MKILNALVGCLAATALHFYPFVLASPLAAIDYDGYADSMQNGDSALMKRVPGDIIEARQAMLVIPVAVLIAAIATEVVLTIVWISSDDPRREAYTYNTIDKTISQYPKWNWVICHSPYLIGFDGFEGIDWGYTHHELSISFGRTIGYDIFWARSGTFFRLGDGGLINWAYNGNILGSDDGGATVHFGVIS